MNAEHFNKFFSNFQTSSLGPYLDEIQKNLEHLLEHKQHGKWHDWTQGIQKIVPITAQFKNLSTMSIGKKEEITDVEYQDLYHFLETLIPWRKGPFHLFDIEIETEWRSDWKWDRIKDHIDLSNKTVLDVGCGSGYHCWRMLDEGAKWVLGIDPTQVYYFQFLLIKKMLGNALPVYFLPIGIEHIPKHTQAFDVVFSMGVLYHRKSPIEHLETLRSQLPKGGTLVLETLVVDGPLYHVLLPKDRYAQMRNVWFLPSTSTLQMWLERVGFTDVTLVDINQTTVEEQRTTHWMPYQSLTDFLKPSNSDLTIEGYPAPKRAFFTAKRV